jgi:LysR family transcriptional activator of nhaA
MSLDWLNYHHLYYFWVVAREGSIVRAARELAVSQPTISLQIRELERSVKQTLFDRVGRRLVLTDAGRLTFSYADEIFGLGRKLADALEHRSGSPAGRSIRMAVGITDAIPKSLARILLQPALDLPKQPVRLVCREDKVDRLLADLAAHRLDVVLSDAPIGSGVHLRGFNHPLGECGVTFLATPRIADKLQGPFPRSLDGAPMLLPTDNTSMRRAIDLWLDAKRIHPFVVAEFEDAAMMTAFGQSGAGIYPAPSLIAPDARKLHGVRAVGSTDAITERYYAITVDEKLKHPGLVAVIESARKQLFQ